MENFIFCAVGLLKSNRTRNCIFLSCFLVCLPAILLLEKCPSDIIDTFFCIIILWDSARERDPDENLKNKNWC